ncbi:MAG: ATP synthase F1 subunit gamma [Saprospiraceae bacterium]|nr:ATP synthase F1 subunit gamma [Saprospiraceae bacterium]
MAANLKEVRERIRSVNNTQQITKAMKVVSAAKLRKAQQAIVQMRPYADKQNEMLRNILSNLDGDASSAFGVNRVVKSACVVVVTSNRGLCGAFNTNVIKEAVKTIESKYADVRAAGNLSLLLIGKKGNEYFKKRYADCHIISDHVNLFGELTFGRVTAISKSLMDQFLEGKYDAVDVAYGRFKNAAMQFPQCEAWLPVPKIEVEEGSKKMKADYIFEPNQAELLEHLVPSILQTSFFKFNLDTQASEHGARMTAMDKASENADELLRELRISYNKARQESITRELSEIVGGAAALESA